MGGGGQHELQSKPSIPSVESDLPELPPNPRQLHSAVQGKYSISELQKILRSLQPCLTQLDQAVQLIERPMTMDRPQTSLEASPPTNDGITPVLSSRQLEQKVSDSLDPPADPRAEVTQRQAAILDLPSDLSAEPPFKRQKIEHQADYNGLDVLMVAYDPEDVDLYGPTPPQQLVHHGPHVPTSPRSPKRLQNALLEVSMEAYDLEDIELYGPTPPPRLAQLAHKGPHVPTSPKSPKRSRNTVRPMANWGSDSSVPMQPAPPLSRPCGPDVDSVESDVEMATDNISKVSINQFPTPAVSGHRSVSRSMTPIPKEEHRHISVTHPPGGLYNSLAAIAGLHDFDENFMMDENEHQPTLHKLESSIQVLDARFPKPKLPCKPPIWAESRQEVCEGFGWFRSYQGGVYHIDNTVRGYLLGGFAARRDVFEQRGRFIISHGGGKSESVHCRGGLYTSTQASDQLSEDKSVRSLLENYRTGRPLVLVIDDKYVLFPYDLTADNVTYAVLGFYTIAYAWAEYQTANNESGRVIRYKFAFQWCEEQGDPWWVENPSEDTILQCPPSSSLTVLEDVTPASGLPEKVSETDFYSDNFTLLNHSPEGMHTCTLCNTASPIIYSSWFCLEPNCKMFWKDPKDQGLIPDPGDYRPGFLQLIPSRGRLDGLRLLPEPVSVQDNELATGYAFTRGVHCPECGRLSCRSQWEKLICLNCSWKQALKLPIRDASALWAGRLPINFDKFELNDCSDITYRPVTSFQLGNGGRGTVQTFHLPENRGKLHHICASTPAGMKEADEIFKRYQEQASCGKLRFRRWPMRAHKCRGTLLTNYFSHNAGEPYQYVGGDANTVPFEDAPAVLDARGLIEKRIQEALGMTASFNEVLSCAYMERQRMAFHSDAEVGLGPLVAGLSLGSPALMHFRIHARHDPFYQQRGILLTVVLRHGDIMVMDGAGVQDFYEHTVVPNNFRIAATARQIMKQHHAKKE